MFTHCYTIYDSLFKMYVVLIFMVFEVASNIDDNKAQFSSEDWTFWGIRASGMHTCRTILKKNNHINKCQNPFVFTSLNKTVFLQKTMLKTENRPISVAHA